MHKTFSLFYYLLQFIFSPASCSKAFLIVFHDGVKKASREKGVISDVYRNGELAIHEMTAINETTTKYDHVLFMCNCFYGLQKIAHACMLLQKSCLENFSKLQQLRCSLLPENYHFYYWWMCFEKELRHDCFLILRHFSV